MGLPNRLLLVTALCAAGCEPPAPEPEIPPLVEPADGDGVTCNRMESTLALHSSVDTLDLDYGGIVFWAFDADSVIWRDDFPQDGDLVFRGWNIHRVGFSQRYSLCMPPGRYVVRAAIDRNHNGWICEPDELWGMTEFVHPLSNEDDARIVLDSVVAPADGCPIEMTLPPVN